MNKRLKFMRLLHAVFAVINSLLLINESAVVSIHVQIRVSKIIKKACWKSDWLGIKLSIITVINQFQDYPQQSYYGVFDGHAGIEAAVYASTHLHVQLTTCEQFPTDPESALKCSYTATDDNFILKAQKEVHICLTELIFLLEWA
jgi:hypothetical protein